MIKFYVEIKKQRKRKGGKERYDAVVGYLPIFAESYDMASEIGHKILENCDALWAGDVKTEIGTKITI